MSTVTLGGNPVNVAGNFPKAGDNAPEFALTGKDLKDVGLKDFAGKRLATTTTGSTFHYSIGILAAKYGFDVKSVTLVPLQSLPNMAAAQVSLQFGLRGYNSTVITACAASSQSIGEALEVLRRGAADVMVTGGTEAGITEIALAGTGEAWRTRLIVVRLDTARVRFALDTAMERGAPAWSVERAAPVVMIFTISVGENTSSSARSSSSSVSFGDHCVSVPYP